VAYTPDWESLAGALERVMATGIIEDEAKIDLRRALHIPRSVGAC
jgi:hypothetical protein